MRSSIIHQENIKLIMQTFSQQSLLTTNARHV